MMSYDLHQERPIRHVSASRVGVRLDGVEVAYGVAMVLPLLLEDHL